MFATTYSSLSSCQKTKGKLYVQQNTPIKILYQKVFFHLSACENNSACLYSIHRSTVPRLVFFLLFLTVPSPFPAILRLLPVICLLAELPAACPLYAPNTLDAFLTSSLLSLFLNFLTFFPHFPLHKDTFSAFKVIKLAELIEI